MGFIFTFACLASLLSFSVIGRSTSSIEGRHAQIKMDPVYKPLQVTRAKLEKRELSKAKNMEAVDFVATPVVSQKTGDSAPKTSERLDRRTYWPSFPRYNFKASRVHALLLQCYSAILPHTQQIRNLCSTGRRIENPEKLGWDLVAELRAILIILLACLSNIQNAGNAPTPSIVPSTRCPTLVDICQIIFRIMCEMRVCFQLITSLCGQYLIVRTVCADTMKQISSCLCNIMIQSSLQVGSICANLGQLFLTTPRFFVNIDFGFQAIPGMLRNHFLFSTFNIRL